MRRRQPVLISIETPLPGPEKKRTAVVCDLDNTLAHLNGRDPYRGDLCASDTRCEPVHLVLRSLFRRNIAIVLLTGRSEIARPATAKWLLRHCVDYDQLVMRDPHDYRAAPDYKLAMLDEVILPSYDVSFALDDDPRVIAVFRERGIPAWHVAAWDDSSPALEVEHARRHSLAIGAAR